MTPTDLGPLALTLFQFLLPHLDYLRGKVADSALSEAGKALVGVVKEKWLAKSEPAKKAVEDLAAHPEDADNRDDVLVQLKKALKADPEFAAEVSRLSVAAGVQLMVTGDNAKVAVVQGDGNGVSIS